MSAWSRIVVVLCGSTRFKTEFAEANRRFTLRGDVVLAPGVFGHADGVEPSLAAKAALDELHLHKIDMADEVFVINPGGYLGESTRAEIRYAEAAGKPVRYLVAVSAGHETAFGSVSISTPMVITAHDGSTRGRD